MVWLPEVQEALHLLTRIKNSVYTFHNKIAVLYTIEQRISEAEQILKKPIANTRRRGAILFLSGVAGFIFEIVLFGLTNDRSESANSGHEGIVLFLAALVPPFLIIVGTFEGASGISYGEISRRWEACSGAKKFIWTIVLAPVILGSFLLLLMLLSKLLP